MGEHIHTRATECEVYVHYIVLYLLSECNILLHANKFTESYIQVRVVSCFSRGLRSGDATSRSWEMTYNSLVTISPSLLTTY